MGSVAMFLEGPGQERRPVKVLSTEQVRLRSGATDGIRIVHPMATQIEVKTLIDADGEIASQVDFDGFRFKYKDSDIPWTLVVG
ncbi:hypothetical protein [Stenotrophomonas sp. ATCM1_4]|uniref:hypothetical protein n=1 Tax=Stenotrophomonas sp. ATCM1_4 TaxID=2259330 RepID=UPI0010466C84|nr:hypothetical protein [Stenotrophomonas sp. ATCM1_4]